MVATRRSTRSSQSQQQPSRSEESETMVPQIETSTETEEEEEEEVQQQREEGEESHHHDTHDETGDASSRRRMRLRPASDRSGRLSRVDVVLHKLKRQREKREGREWMDGRNQEEAEGEAGDEEEEEEEAQQQAGDDSIYYVAPPSPPSPGSPLPRKRSRLVDSAIGRQRYRSSAADEYDDGSGFVVHSDEEEAEAARDESDDEARDEDEADGSETVSHMRLHHQMQVDSEEGGTALSSRLRGAAHTATSPLAAFSTHSHFGPVLSLEVSFHYWVQYLATVLVDPSASPSLMSLSSTRRLLDKAAKVVEEQFDSRLSNWVQSSVWQQRGMEQLYECITQLPYITSRPIGAYDRIAESGDVTDSGTEAGGGTVKLCDACRGQHQASHSIEVFGVPYDCTQLTHPFDSKRIFRCQPLNADKQRDDLEYTREVFHVGELCLRRVRLFHAMRHFKLRTMLLLRALLDKVGAVPGDVTRNTIIVQCMFPTPVEGRSLSCHSSTAAGRTVHLLRKQLVVRQRLFAMSEGYSTSDARTVRTVDVSELDELYDIVNEACSTKLFALRPPNGRGDNTTVRAEQSIDARDGVDAESDSEEHGEVYQATEQVATSQKKVQSASVDSADVLPTRKLVLDALLKGGRVTSAELRYLFDRLPADMQEQWQACGVSDV